MTKCLWLAFWLLLTFLGLNAQQLHWNHFRLPPSLSDTQPRLLYQRHNGLIYLATSDGLCSFDGVSFTPISCPEGTSTDIRAIFEDRDNIVWIGYADGSVNQLLNGQLVPWRPEEGHPAIGITGFAEDNAGQLWLATYGEGAYLVSGRHLYNFNDDDGLPSNDIYTIAHLVEDEVWLGTDSGISICTFRNGKKSVANLSRKDGLPDEIIRVLLPDASGNCWIGTHDEGVVFYDRSTATFRTLIDDWPYGPVNSLSLFENRYLSIATEEQGSWRIDLNSNILRPVNPVPGTKLKALHLLPDAEGGLWLLSRSKGIFRAKQQLAYFPAPDREVQAVYADKEGKVWAGTDRGLYWLSAKGELQPYHSASNLSVVSLFQDRYANLWLGTFGDGVYIINLESGVQRHLGKREGLLDGSILSIDGQGNKVWLASLGGVTEVSLNNDPLTTSSLPLRKIDGLKTDFIYQVLAETPDRIWFATDGEGLACLDHGQVTHLREIRTIQGDSVDLRRVYSLSLSPDGSLWFNTASQGLFKLTDDSLSAFKSDLSLSGERITGLAAQSSGELILSHSDGVAVLNGVMSERQRIRKYQDEETGFRPILNAVATAHGNETWFGCSGGMIQYYGLPRQTIDHPRVLLHSVYAYPTGQPRPKGTKFAYNENTLAFNFLSLWYTDPETISCRYRLNGYDPGWIETRNQQVIYSRLPPGNYTFEVATTVGENWSDADVESYRFSIAPPFWQRWWFLLPVMLTVGFLVIFLLRYRERQLKRETLLQKQRVESQYEALKSQISPHFLFNNFNTLITLIEEAPEDAVIYTEKLSDLFRNVLLYRDRETISLQEELTLVANYLFLLDKRFGDKLTVTIQIDQLGGHIVPLSLQLLVENAIKHNVVSARRPLFVRIERSSDGAYIYVQHPYQPKRRKEPSTGFGLASLAERYSLLTQKEIIRDETEGQFRVCIPLLPAPSAVKIHPHENINH